jgi:hypothetical protein
MTDNESYSEGVRNQAASDDLSHTHLDPADSRLSDLLKRRWSTLGSGRGGLGKRRLWGSGRGP